MKKRISLAVLGLMLGVSGVTHARMLDKSLHDVDLSSILGGDPDTGATGSPGGGQ